MRIGIVTSGRFHVLDFARELAALGNDVTFYSYVPRKRAQRFGLPAGCVIVPLLPLVFPLGVLAQRGPTVSARPCMHTEKSIQQVAA